MLKRLLFFCLFLISATPQILTTEHLPSFVGVIPAKITRIITYLKRLNSTSYSEQIGTTIPISFKNRFILYGPPGNGKSTLAYLMAQESNCELIRLDGPSIVGSYVGQGAQAVKDTFQRAYDMATSTNRCVIIFIDEIDAIAANNTSEFRAEHQAALQQLWLELDHCKHNHRIFVLLATNYFTKLNKTFLDRFGNNILEIKNPDADLRREILLFYIKNYHVVISTPLLDIFVEKTEGLSIRSLEDFIAELTLLQTLEGQEVNQEEALGILQQIRKKFDENQSDKKEGNESELQKWSLRIGIASGILSSAVTLYQLANVVMSLLNLYNSKNASGNSVLPA